MPPTTSSSLSQTIKNLFEAERNVRKLRAELSSSKREGEVLDAIQAAIAASRNESSEDERVLQLTSLAGILGRMVGPRTVDLLIEILDSEEPDARLIAGGALEDLAFDRFKEVAQGIERALTRLQPGSPALPELPFVIVEVPEPAVLKIVHKFLSHPDPEAVAAGIEACVELGDPKSGSQLQRLENDRRTVEIEDEPENVTVTIGELAQEARSILEMQGVNELS